jgi:ATP-dependent Clp protease ATP-binding subunit ClpC
MNTFIYLHAQYTSLTGSLIRLMLFAVLFGLIVYLLVLGESPKIPLFFFNIFVMVELFMHFHVGRRKPSQTLTTATPDSIMQTLTIESLTVIVMSVNIHTLLIHLISKPQVAFILKKAGVDKKEVEEIAIEKEKIIAYAAEIAKQLHGSYVTTMDIFIAYLLLTEADTKLLFSKKLKPDELLHILYWARLQFPFEEQPKQLRLHYSGSGIGDLLINGWTPETKKYTVDWTAESLMDRPTIYGREKEYEEIIEALEKHENNNVLLVGEPGIGKETLIRAIAYDSFIGLLPKKLNHKRLLELLAGLLISGVNNKGDLEGRLESIIAEVSHAGNLILYIPELQDMLGAGSYQVDLADALYPYIKNERMPIIASMTPGNYKTYFEKGPLHEVFTTIHLAEPDHKTAVQMLFEKTREIEEKYHVTITYQAVVSAVQYAKTYFPDDVLPGSGVALLADAANNAAHDATHKKTPRFVTDQIVIQQVELRTNVAVAAPTETEKTLLLHLEEELHKRVIGQDFAIEKIAQGMRRMRTNLTSSERPVSFLFLGPTGVGKTESAKALADIYFHGQSNIIRLDMSEYATEEGVIRMLGDKSNRGELTEKVHDKPFSLILLDEFEKAHPKILNLFLQVLDDGRLTDGSGRTVSFAHTIIIATSNAGAELIREEITKGTTIDEKYQLVFLEKIKQAGSFKPELLNRFDEVVMFRPLTQTEVEQVVSLLLTDVQKKLAKEDVTVTFTKSLIKRIAEEGFDMQFGARPLRRFIQDHIESALAEQKLKDSITRGSTITLDTNQQGIITISP